MVVFVTGGSGFIGGHVIEGLVASGHEVRAMARSARSEGKVERFGAEARRCSLGAVSTNDLDGVDVIVHCAAFAEEWGTREQFWRANVDGTVQLLEVAKEAGVSRFVHIGTEAALFNGAELVDVDETAPYPTPQRFLYSESKAEAEKHVLGASDEAFAALSIRPRMVWGPRDATILPALIRIANEGGFAWIDGGRALTSTTYISNLVDAIVQALTLGRGGEAYFIADDGTTTVREFITALLGTQGITLPSRNVPGALMRPLASVVEGTWRLLRIKTPPPITRLAAAFMSRSVTVVTDKAKRDLEWTPKVTRAAGLAAMAPG